MESILIGLKYFISGSLYIAYAVCQFYVLITDHNNHNKKTELLRLYFNSWNGSSYVAELNKLDSKYTANYLRKKYSKSTSETEFINMCNRSSYEYEDFSID